MYKHILLPTDGSALAQSAVQYGITLAKSVGAKVTGITVTEPFHVFAVDAEMLTDGEVLNLLEIRRGASFA